MNLSYLLAAAVPRDSAPDPRPIAAVLTTTNRTEYLIGTLESLESAGADERFRRIVLYQGSGVGMPTRAGWQYFQSAARLEGSVMATVAAMAVADLANAPFLLLFEDDLITERGAVSLMAMVDVPEDLAFISFFDSRWLDVTDGRANRLLELRPNEGGPCHFGNLALKIPRRTLAVFSDLLETFEADSPNEMDVQLPRLLVGYRSGRYGLYCPSLVQHMGARSLITPGEPVDGYGRSARNYVADAGELRLLRTRPPRELCLTSRPGKA